MISLRDEIGDREPALMFSLCGLDRSERGSAQGVLGRTVLEEPPETLSVQLLRLAKAKRPRYMGVLSRGTGLCLDDHELKRILPAGFFARGTLLDLSINLRRI
jgi:hypothetical protein